MKRLISFVLLTGTIPLLPRAYPDTHLKNSQRVVISDTSKKVSPSEKLYRAVLNDSAEEVKTAVQGGIDVNQSLGIRTEYAGQDSPIATAVLLSRPIAVKTLLELGVDPNAGYSGPSMLSQGYYTGGSSMKYYYFRLLDYALLIGDMRSALAFVKAGAKFGHNVSLIGSDINTDIINNTNIMGYALAFYNQDPSTCYELIKELFKRGYNKLRYSANTGLYRVNPWVLAMHPAGYVSVGSRVPVLNKELVELFIANDLDINEKIASPYGQLTPLSMAVKEGDAELVKLLRDRGARDSL